MEIIPVLDLMAGQVVHAKRGERNHYRPIRSCLCSTAEPLTVAEALLGLYPFKTLYIADLDAICKTGQHQDVISQLRKRHPALILWLDAGFGTLPDISGWLELGIIPVIGTESLPSLDEYHAIRREVPNHVLSLDFKPEGYQGPAQLLLDASLWPQSVVAMTLAKVGSSSGPDTVQLASLKAQSLHKEVFAAGGVRHMDDVLQLQRLGIAGALVATGLHTGAIGKRELADAALLGALTCPAQK